MLLSPHMIFWRVLENKGDFLNNSVFISFIHFGAIYLLRSNEINVLHKGLFFLLITSLCII